MRKTVRVLGILLLSSGWVLAAAAVHVVRTPGQVLLIPKDRLTFHDTFVDTRRWTLADVRAHPALVGRLLHLNHADLLAQAAEPGKGDTAQQLADAADHPLPEVVRENPHPLLKRITDDVHTATAAVRAFFD